MSDINASLTCWNRRNTTIYGRILVVKTVVISKFLYRASILPVPANFIKLVNEMVYSFVWKNKKHLVKKSTLVNCYEEGGLQMPDMKLW